MKSLFGFILMLPGFCYGLGSCRDEGTNVTRCYGILGGNVTLINVSAADRCEVKFNFPLKQSELIIMWRNNAFIINKENRAFIFPNTGTLGMKNLSRNDGGEYQLVTFNKEGMPLEERTLLLTVQAPVTSVQLLSRCLSQGEMHVSCSSEDGDTPEYSWTLNGKPVKDTDLLSGNTTTNIITLKQNVEGRLVCSVKNDVSSVSKAEQIVSCVFLDCFSNGTEIKMWAHKENRSLCDEPTTASTTVTQPIAGKETKPIQTSTKNTSSTSPPSFDNTYIMFGGIFAGLLFLLAVGVTIICSQKKKENKQAEEIDEEELTYADVRILQKNRRSMQQKVDVEVEYGQLKFSERPQQTVPPSDDCVYAMVRKDR